MIVDANIENYRGYLGNSLLKRSGVQMEWTEELVSEYIKCSKDPIYFIETYMKIVNVDKGLVNFNLYSYQKEVITAIHENRRTILCFPRQSGKSTSVIGYVLWYILFNDNVTVAILANKGKTAREVMNKAQKAYLHLPKFLQQGVELWNQGQIILENGSRAMADSTSSDAIRGWSCNMIIMDEVAQIEHWTEFSTSVIPTISSGKTTKIVQLSTPYGLNHFYKTWMEAQDPNSKDYNGYYPIKINWWETPGRDQHWKEETLKELNNDVDKFRQEYEVEFMGSSGTLINGKKLQELVKRVPLLENEGLHKYFQPIRGHFYIMTIDVSEGKGMDNSAFQIIDITSMPYQQVCTYESNKITPDEFAQICFEFAKQYNQASVLVEYENLGPEVASILHDDLEYPNILFTESAGQAGKRLSEGGSKTAEKGLKMSRTVKATGCSLLKLLIEQDQLIINDFQTIFELSRFSKKGKSYEAESGNHDDLISCLIVFSWLSNQPFFKELTDINTISKLRDKNIQEINDDITPFGFIDDHTDSNPNPIFVNYKDQVFTDWLKNWEVKDLPNF